FVADEVGRHRLHRGIAAAMKDEALVAAEQPRGIDAQGKVAIDAAPGIVPDDGFGILVGPLALHRITALFRNIPSPACGGGVGWGMAPDYGRRCILPAPSPTLPSPASGGGFVHYIWAWPYMRPSSRTMASASSSDHWLCIELQPSLRNVPSPACGGGLGWGMAPDYGRRCILPAPSPTLPSPASGGGFIISARERRGCARGRRRALGLAAPAGDCRPCSSPALCRLASSPAPLLARRARPRRQSRRERRRPENRDGAR